MAVVGALLLLAVDRDLGAVQIKHHAPRGFHRFHSRKQLPVDRRQPGEVLVLGQQLRLERVHSGRQGRPALPDLLRPDQPEGRITGEALRVIHVLVARQPAVD